MNIKKTANSQLSISETEKNQKNKTKQKLKQTKQTTRIGTESQKWRSHGRLSAGRGQGGEWGQRYRE